MAVKNIKLGQVWRQDQSGKDFLVTKVYSEVFTQYAVLRPAEVNAPNVPGRESQGCQVGRWSGAAGIHLYTRRGLLIGYIGPLVIGPSDNPVLL